MQIRFVPALKDNYIWILTDEVSGVAWVVDPGEAQGVLLILHQLKLALAGILLTHHHQDHCGGVGELLIHYPDVLVYGSAKNSNIHINRRVDETQSFMCLSREVKILEIPGHTLDHVAYHIEDNLFSGDTLFSVGCGRIFEGTVAQMYASLQKIFGLNDATKIYCGHEYTLANIQFALLVDPENQTLQHKLTTARSALQNEGCTLPGVLGEEKKINPFFRCSVKEIITRAETRAGKPLNNPIEVLHILREWKNQIS